MQKTLTLKQKYAEHVKLHLAAPMIKEVFDKQVALNNQKNLDQFELFKEVLTDKAKFDPPSIFKPKNCNVSQQKQF